MLYKAVWSFLNKTFITPHVHFLMAGPFCRHIFVVKKEKKHKHASAAVKRVTDHLTDKMSETILLNRARNFESIFLIERQGFC